MSAFKGPDVVPDVMPRSPLRTVMVSTIIGVACAGVMFAYNLPGALAAGLQEDFGITAGDISWLMTAYTVPSALTAMVAAEAMAVIGLIPVCLICAGAVQLGTVMFALAPTLHAANPLTAMLTAQLVIGSGDALGLACSPALVARWWRHNHHGLAMGTTLMVTQLVGATLPFTLLPRVHADSGLRTALWVGALVQLLSLVCLVFFCLLERFYASYLDLVDAADSRNDGLDGCAAVKGNATPGFIPRLQALPVNVWLQILAVCLIPVTQYVSLGLLPAYLSAVHGMSEIAAGERISFVWWFCVTAPLWGMVADNPRFGRLHIQLVSAFVASLCFLALSAGVEGWWVLTVLGISFAMLDQNAYVCVEALVPDAGLIDFTYGVMGAIFNVGMGLVSYIAGWAPIERMPLVFFSSLWLGVLVTLCLLRRLDPWDAAERGLLPQLPCGGAPTSLRPDPEEVAVMLGKSADTADDVDVLASIHRRTANVADIGASRKNVGTDS